MKNSGIEWIGEIPDSWNVVQLASLFIEHKQKNTGMQSRNLLSLSYGKIKRKDINTSDGLLPESFENYNVVDSGDIVLRLTDLQNDQRSLRTGLCLEKGIVTSAYVTLRKRNANLNSEFMHYYLHSFDVRKGFYGMGSGVRQGLNFDGIKKLAVLLPPQKIQEAIVEYLSKKLGEVDKLIDIQQAQIDKLKEYKQSVITEAVTKGLDPTVPMKDVSNWMRRIPCNWFEPKIKYFCSIESGGTPERTHPEYWNGDINWFKTGELHNDEIFDSEEKITVKAIEETAAKIFPKNTILVAMYGQGKTRGMTALLKKESATNQACAAIQLKTKTYEVNYLWWVLKGAYNSLRERANGSGQPNLSVSLISEFEISLPPLLEQQKIICYLDDKCAKIDKLIALKQAKIDKLQEYKKSLIYEYVTGKKEVV